MSFLNVKIELLDPICAPKQKTDGAAGFDLVAREGLYLDVGTRATIPVGIKLELPPGTEAQIRGRSSLNFKGYEASFGTIDSDYRGEVLVIMANKGQSPLVISRGDRVAQMVIQELPRVRLELLAPGEKLTDTARGAGGFGSTGTSDLNSGTDS